ncbi:histidine ammonia-lyase [Plakobranchus ocellatus]|uniref:Histidine ammonia-lyase n=1 Tax=Plakobranchus ocellatus TaxID=259542 RepID=A0AAV4DFH0_9GAST|nr:histidine ammonia-lyase [Plakobranchus ocellatus]
MAISTRRFQPFKQEVFPVFRTAPTKETKRRRKHASEHPPKPLAPTDEELPKEEGTLKDITNIPSGTMKLSVRVRGDWFAVPCKGGDTIRWLGEEALRRYYKKKAASGADGEKVHEVRKTKGGALLDFDDSVKDVLDDNDFVTVGRTDFKYGVDNAVCEKNLKDVVEENNMVMRAIKDSI